MKNKHIRGIIIDIITIALCITAIFVGIFSAKNANLNISGEIGFEKHDKTFYIASVTEKMYVDSAWTDVTTNKLCTTMGHSIIGSTETEAGTDGLTETPIQWYAFAVRGDKTSDNKYNTKPTDIFNTNSTTITSPITTISTYTNGEGVSIEETWYSLYGVDMSKVSYTGKTFWFIQQYIVAGGYYNGEGSYVDGIEFDSRDCIYAQDSKKSEIYTFINGTDETSYVGKTGISSDDTYADISARTVDESYSVYFSNEYVTDSKLACKFTSKFWLLNKTELGLLTNRSAVSNYVTKTYGINAQNGNSNNKYGGSWWLRAPYASYGTDVHVVSYSGVFNNDFTTADDGVRAAFQITL